MSVVLHNPATATKFEIAKTLLKEVRDEAGPLGLGNASLELAIDEIVEPENKTYLDPVKECYGLCQSITFEDLAKALGPRYELGERDVSRAELEDLLRNWEQTLDFCQRLKKGGYRVDIHVETFESCIQRLREVLNK